jgi:hypothetical protein
VDTAFFTGNYSPKVSVYGMCLTDPDQSNPTLAAINECIALREASAADRPEFLRMGLAASDAEFAAVAKLQSEQWAELIPLTPLGAGYEATRRTMFTVAPQPAGSGNVFTHLRINMGPDGGIARVRVYGEVVVPPSSFVSPTGGCCTYCTDFMPYQRACICPTFLVIEFAHPIRLFLFLFLFLFFYLFHIWLFSHYLSMYVL